MYIYIYIYIPIELYGKSETEILVVYTGYRNEIPKVNPWETQCTIQKNLKLFCRFGEKSTLSHTPNKGA